MKIKACFALPLELHKGIKFFISQQSRHLSTSVYQTVERNLSLKVYKYKTVPRTIPAPPYVSSGVIDRPISPEVKTNDQIDKMRPSCQLAAQILRFVGEKLQAGMTTEEIDDIVFSKCIEAGAYPSPLQYKGFPKSVCTSVNNVACHGIPGSLVLLDGDIINVDITVFFKGYHGDTSATFCIGDVDERSRNLVKAAQNCRDAGISICKDGVMFSDIGDIIHSRAIEAGFEVMPIFCGHGIGEYFHGPPDIVHVPNDYNGDQRMKAGMTFTIEPILCDGGTDVQILDDGWTVVSVDGCRSAQFEHTIFVTQDGCEILTL